MAQVMHAQPQHAVTVLLHTDGTLNIASETAIYRFALAWISQLWEISFQSSHLV